MIPEKKSPPLRGVASCLLSSSAASAAEDRRMHIATTKLKRWLFIVAGTIKNEICSAVLVYVNVGESSRFL